MGFTFWDGLGRDCTQISAGIMNKIMYVTPELVELGILNVDTLSQSGGGKKKKAASKNLRGRDKMDMQEEYEGPILCTEDNFDSDFCVD